MKNFIQNGFSKLFAATLFLALLALPYGASAVGLSGSYTIGPTGSYASLTAAAAALHTNGVSGAVTMQIQSTYNSSVETYPIVFSTIAGTSAANNVVIEPASGATGLVVTGSNATAIIQFSGATYVTIDGRPGGTGGSSTTSGFQVSGSLQIINTNTAAISTVEFISDAQNNTLQYCNVEGSSINHATSSSVSAATVYIGAGVTNGNDNNIIQYCDVHASSAGLPVTAIGSYNAAGPGTVKDNDGVKILYNNIYDFSTLAVASDTAAGIFISTGNNTYTISNNSIYEAGAVSMSGATTMFSFILVNTDKAETNVTYGSGFTIANNYCGGSAPLCGGSAMSLTGASTLRLLGIYATFGNGALSTINSNTISNINFTTASTTTGVAGSFSGISAAYGNYAITNNTIGGSSANNITVNLTASASNITGIGMAGGLAGFNLPVTGNTINNITVTSATNTIYGSLMGIYSTVGTGNFTLGGASSALGNTITNLTDGPASGTATLGQALGVYVVEVGSNTFTIQNNTIHDIVCNELNAFTTGNDYNACAAGVSINAGSATNTVSSNTIYNISNGGNANTAVSYNPLVVGITEAAGACTISGNLIYSLDVPKWVPSASATNIPRVTAIDMYVCGGTSTIINNMVRLGINNAGASSIYPINFQGISVGTNVFGTASVWFNSVYIGGAETGPTTLTTNTFNATSAFFSNDITIMNISNNIFDNSRTSAGSTPHNYSLNLYQASEYALNNNDYYYPGGTSTGNYFAITGNSPGTDVPAYYSAWTSGDVNSVAGNPLFSSPAGAFTTTAPLNLDVTSGSSPIISAGVTESGVTTDYHGTLRATYNTNPKDDIGADVVILPNCTTPTAQPTSLVLTPGASVITGSFAAASPPATGYLVVQYAHGATATAPSNLTTYTVGSAIGTGIVVSVGTGTTYTSSGLAATTSYDYYIYAYNSGSACIGPEYDLTSPLFGSSTTIGCGTANGLTGVVPVGPAYSANNQTGFTNLTNALTWINNYGLNAATTLSLQSNYTSSTETFPIIFGSNTCITAAHPLTVEPATGATGLQISSSNTTATVQFIGATNVTIDGRPGGSGTSTSGAIVGDLAIINTATNDSATMLIENSSQNITVRYCDIQGSESNNAGTAAPVSAVVYIENNSNSNNNISYNSIHSYGSTNLPLNGIAAYSGTGTANDNTNNTIDHNNIYDFSALATGNTTNGIWIATGNDAYTITNNSVYQSSGVAANQTMNGSGVILKYINISANNSTATTFYSGFNISNNYCGGTAPSCGGTQYSVSGTTQLRVIGISTNLGNGTQNVINGNTISNIAMNVYNNTGGSAGAFTGIAVTYGNTAVTNNTIGGSAANSIDIVPTVNGTSVIGILVQGTIANTLPVTGNVINNISLLGTGTNYGSIYGLYLYGSLATINAGGATAALGNQISNLTEGAVGSTSALGQVVGVYVVGTLPTLTIQNNTIFNFINNTPSVTSGASACLMGMYFANTAGTTYNVNNNTIYNLQDKTVSTLVSFTPVIYGIYFNGVAACNYNLNANLIHSFDYPNWAPSGTVTGQAQIVGVAVSAGIMVITNNMIRLGINPSGASVKQPMFMVGFYRSASATQAYTLQFNSVYIGGTTAYSTSATTFYSAAFDNRPTAGAMDIRDNIFENVRSSTSGTPYNYAFSHNATSLPASINLNYNDYYVSGTGSFLARNNATNISTYTGAGSLGAVFTSDVNSKVGDPLYINPTGTAATVNLAINFAAEPVSPADANGVAIGTITTDFYGNTRANLTPTDIGADAFVGMIPGNNGNPGICPGTTLSLNDTIKGTVPVGTTFSWSGPNGFTASTQAATVSNMSSANVGAYYVTATFPGGLTETDSTVVTLNPSPAATASNTGIYLPGQTISLSSGPSGQTSYSWSGPQSFTASTQNATRTGATSLMSGNYIVTVTNSVGCSDTAITFVSVNALGDYVWTGATNNSWTTVTNWSPNAPVGGPSGCTENVIIPNTVNDPVISSAISIGNITINDNASLTLNGSLSVCGFLAGGTTTPPLIVGTSHLILNSSTAAQAVSGILSVNYLEISNTAPGTWTAAGIWSTANITVNKALIMTQGNFYNTTGSVSLASNASGDAYLDNFTSGSAGTYSGNLTVQRYISNTSDGYRDLGSAVNTTVNDLNNAYPVSGQNFVECWYAYSPYPNVQTYNETLIIPSANGSVFGHWTSYTSLGARLSPMMGYAFRTYKGSSYTINFTGQPNSGAYTQGITHTSSAIPANDGWNFLSNPYPSPIKWSLVKAMNAAVVNGEYYVYNTTGEFTGNWGTYNGTTGVNGAIDEISSSQGFFVQAPSATTFRMDNTVRTTNTSGQYFGASPVLDNEVRLVLTGAGNSDEIVTYTDAQATDGYDADLDAVKMPAGSTVGISYRMPDHDYAINVMNTINAQTELPLSITVSDTGAYTLNATILNVPGLTAYLRDAESRQNISLTSLANGPVTLNLNGGQTYSGRYSVVFQPIATTGIINTEASATRIYSYEDKVYVTRSSSTPAVISVTNLLGQDVADVNTDTQQTEFELPSVQPWYAIVKVTEENGKMTVGKVLISGKQ